MKRPCANKKVTISMTSETYFPEQRHMLSLTLIRRERMLPEDTEAQVEASVGSRVGLRDVIARGSAPAPYTLIDAMRFFRLKNPEDLKPLLEVTVGDIVSSTQTLAARGRRRLVSPIVGKVAAIDAGRIVLQAAAETVELDAGLSGQIVEVRKGRGVVIETFGAVLQGVWGNNRRTVGTIRIDPPNGIENVDHDAIDTHFRGAILVTRRSLTSSLLRAMVEQGFAGLIAPSMETGMIKEAVSARAAILLTDGFGSQRMNTPTYQFMDEMDGRQATLDAIMPGSLELRRPEVIINVPLHPQERPSAPLTNLSLQQGMQVRVVHGGGSVAFGQVIGLPKTPVLLDNGLRVQCAQVELVTGEKLMMPLANIEAPGR
jgi:hypothetical protein